MFGLPYESKRMQLRRFLVWPAALLLGLTFSSGCTELSVPPVIEETFMIPPPDQGPGVRITWEGEGLESPEWIRSYTVYRIFFDDLENTSGSIRTLLEPGVVQSIHRNEFKVARDTGFTDSNNELNRYATAQTDCTLSIKVEQRDLSYFPRREFVQTPGGIRPGHIVTLFRYNLCVDDECQDYKIERTVRTHTDEAGQRLEMEANMVLKEIQKQTYTFLRQNRALCEDSSNN